MGIRRVLTGAALAFAVTTASQAADPIRADWLYLTGDGAWVQRSHTLNQATQAVPLPVEQLDADRFWWRAEHNDVRIAWQSPSLSERLTVDAVVQVEDWPGSWTLVQAEPELLILAQAGVRRALPAAQWHRLSWVAGKHRDRGFELTVNQPEARTNPFEYAWLDPAITARVRYSLTLNDAAPVLRQQLVLHNRAEYAIEAPGFSFAQHRSTGQGPQARTVQALSAETDSAAPAPGSSSGQATLKAETPIFLESRSHRWLAVQTVPLASVTHHYQFNWSTQSTGTQSGRWSLAVRAEEALPDIAGPVQVAVWDREVGLLDAQYTPQRARGTRLDLGPSDQMTLSSERAGDNRWRLTLTNRNAFTVESRLVISHWDRQRREQAELVVTVPGGDTRAVSVRLDADGLSAQSR